MKMAFISIMLVSMTTLFPALSVSAQVFCNGTPESESTLVGIVRYQDEVQLDRLEYRGQWTPEYNYDGSLIINSIGPMGSSIFFNYGEGNRSREAQLKLSEQYTVTSVDVTKSITGCFGDRCLDNEIYEHKINFVGMIFSDRDRRFSQLPVLLTLHAQGQRCSQYIDYASWEIRDTSPERSLIAFGQVEKDF